MHRVHPNRIGRVHTFIELVSREQSPNDVLMRGSCAICMEDFELGGDRVAQLACSNRHIFHTECLKRWVELNSVCPLCREQIPELGANI